MNNEKPLTPGDTIGILGGGQLGRMMAQSAASLGLKTHIFCPDAASPAFEVSHAHTIAPYEDFDALEKFAQAVSVITYEFENVPSETAQFLAKQRPLRPGANALKISQDRLFEKEFLSNANVEIAGFAAVNSQQELQEAIERFSGTGVLKTRRMGYDGKGQKMIRALEDLDDAFSNLGSVPAILEAFVPFESEVSVIVARDVTGQTASYDVARNHHENHILKTSTVPADIPSTISNEANEIARKIVEGLEYVGVMGVEMFLVREGNEQKLIVNEIAPRVHNSGHWTQDACLVSQFDQHIRAVAGWPLGSTERHFDAEMENLIGHEVDQWPNVLDDQNAKLHLYGKTETRPGRKMGHINRVSPKSSV